MKEILVSLDSDMLLIVGFVLLAIVVLFIVMKLVKVALVAAVLCLVVFLGVPYVESIKEVVTFDKETKSITIQHGDEDFTLDLDSIKTVKIVDGRVEFEVTDGSVRDVQVPKYAMVLVEQYLKSQDIEVVK